MSSSSDIITEYHSPRKQPQHSLNDYYDSYNTNTSHIRFISILSILFLLLGYLLLFSIRTHIIITCISIGIGGLLYSTSLVVVNNGLLNYLPVQLRHKLLHERLIDIIQEPIINPKTLLTVMSIFVTELSNDEKQRIISRLPYDTAKVFDTKGLINLLPHNIRNIILPRELRSLQQYSSSSDNITIISDPTPSIRLIQAPGGALANGHSSATSPSNSVSHLNINTSNNNNSITALSHLQQVNHHNDQELISIKNDFNTFCKRALHSYLNAFIGSTLGEKVLYNVKNNLPSQQTVQNAGIAITLSTSLLFTLNKTARQFAKSTGVLALSSVGFIAATYSLYILINAVAKNQNKNNTTTRRKHIWQHREAYLSTLAFSLWLVFLRNGLSFKLKA